MPRTITARFHRIIAGPLLFVLLAALNTALSAEAQTGSSAEGNAEATEHPEVSEESQESNEASAKADSSAEANGSVTIMIGTPDADPIMAAGEEIANATLDFVDDVNGAAQDAVADTVSNDIAASVDASVKEDVRASIQDDLVTELTRSLPLPGQD